MNKIIFHRIGFSITQQCTLKCRLCSAYIPYRLNPKHYPYSELENEITRFFELVDWADIFTISGGEPFLYNELPALLDYIGQYRTRIGRLEVVTSGSVLPSVTMVQSLKNSKTRVLLDDYGSKLSIHVSEIESMLKENLVEYTRRYNSDTEKGAHCNGWVDLLRFSDYPVSTQKAKDLFSRCVLANELRCHPVLDGKIYVCSTAEYCVRQGRVEDDPRYFIDLLDTSQSIEEQKEKIVEFLKLDVLPSCAFCSGWLSDSKRYVPAEQLTKEEMTQVKKIASQLQDRLKAENKG